MAKLAYAWNPPDMDPRNVTLRGAAVDIDPAEESTREESTREGSTLAKEMRKTKKKDEGRHFFDLTRGVIKNRCVKKSYGVFVDIRLPCVGFLLCDAWIPYLKL